MQDLITSSDIAPLEKPIDNLSNTDPRQRAWLEVSPLSVETNTHSLVRGLAKSSSLMAVVKADGYGHGAETIAKAALRGGAASLGVATLQEGIDLRRAGIMAVPILVMGNLTSPNELRACIH